jgi:hypothetical protein
MSDDPRGSLCTQCYKAERVPGQRWCQSCRRNYQRQWAKDRNGELRHLREENAQLRAEVEKLRMPPFNN